MPRILIMYADGWFRKKLWLALVKIGYEVIEAVNIQEALRLNRYLPADVLLTDRSTPETERFSAMTPGQRRIRVVMFSPVEDRDKIVLPCDQIDRIAVQIGELF